MRFFPRKLWLQLLLPILIVVILVGIVSGYVHMRTHGDQLLNTMITGADQLSGSIASATWHAMLADNREAAYEIMQTIATKQGISRIRIYNKEGRVMYSTAPGDTGSVDKAAEACFICHATDRPLVKIDVPSRARVFRQASGKHILGIVTPVYNEPACSNAECHAHPASLNVLGVIDVSMDLTEVDREINEIQRRTFLISLVLSALLVVVLIVFTRKYVDAPIHKLIEATHAVSTMNLDKPVKITSSEELGDLAHSFDTMRVQLKTAIDELNTLAGNLEIKVTERTEQLRVAQQKLFHTDRLASLGQLSASVAHEINNPLSGVLNLSMLMQRIIKEDGIPQERIPEVRKYLSQVVTETARVGRIVQDLLAFSRRSKPHQRANVNFNSIVSTTVNLIGHKLKLMNVEMNLRLDENLPPIHCDSSQMQQVLINLIMNGAEAAQGHAEAHVRVSTQASASSNEFTLEVADTGDGIKPEHMEKLFTPFFTTKGEGKGIGLGLAVVYGIVKDHGGDIDVDTKRGKATTFIVTLPIDGSGTPAPASGTG
ncbi:MAG TPA: ATP-binding protein [Bacteroidota bacterium]|nr:ATP-binding protein [Bacteroidota bacterium]